MHAVRSRAAALVRQHRTALPVRVALRARRRLPALVHARAQRDLIAAFLRTAPRRLHLGAGPNVLPGWLNTDLDARPAAGVARLDATKPFPLPDGCCDVVFCEHLIEHLSFADGGHCLRECRRVLRRGGVVRVATPNLRRIAGLAVGEAQWYLNEAAPHLARNYPGVPPLAAVVVNNFFRDWGHQFIYDAESLSYALESAGFADVRECAVGESEHPELRGVEHHGVLIGDRMNRFETLVLEATAR